MEITIFAIVVTVLNLLLVYMILRQEIRTNQLQKDIGDVFEMVATEILDRNLRGKKNGNKMDKTGN
jgi:DNA-binding HxlR family transcriptional regulator